MIIKNINQYINGHNQIKLIVVKKFNFFLTIYSKYNCYKNTYRFFALAILTSVK